MAVSRGYLNIGISTQSLGSGNVKNSFENLSRPRSFTLIGSKLLRIADPAPSDSLSVVQPSIPGCSPAGARLRSITASCNFVREIVDNTVPRHDHRSDIIAYDMRSISDASFVSLYRHSTGNLVLRKRD